VKLAHRALAIALTALAPLVASAPAHAAGLPPIRHVFVIVLENESASTTFGPNSPAPYLAKTLTGEGAYLPNYYGIGHQSNDNYIALISGQAPNPDNQADCLPGYDNFEPDVIGSDGQAVGQGCIFPADVRTIADQLDAAGLTWRDYNESMGSDPAREAAECGHPGIDQPDNTESATATDPYAARHNPFVYFHSIIDDTTRCDTHVVNLNLLQQDLAAAASTANYVFITPDLCSDGHDATCANASRPGGYAGIDSFLQQWVPRITQSPAFRTQNGLLAIIFDEASSSDASSCCGEIPGPNSPQPGATGPGGGDTGAVLISPCIAPGTVSSHPYNHYTLLRSIEDLFGLAHLGYAELPGESSLGSDVFNRPCGTAPVARVQAPKLASAASAGPRFNVTWSATTASTFTVQVRRTSGRGGGWRTLRGATTARSLKFHAREGATYSFRVRATGTNGISGDWAATQTVVPSATRVAGARYRGRWRRARFRDAWNGHALIGSAGSSATLAFVGGALVIIGDISPRGGRMRVTIDGRSRTVSLRSSRRHARHVLFWAAVRPTRHRLVVRILAGPVPIEAVAIVNRKR
jgi:hypothetical protein